VTHYDALGAERTATTTELREAFRRAARAAHPDRHGEASSRQMAAVNEAWHVLGDAERRRRYDAELDAAERSGSSDQSSSRQSTAAAPPPTPVAHVEPARFPWRFMAGLLSVGVALVVTGVIVYDPPPPAAPDGILRPGDCVALSQSLAAVEVPCGEHDAVVDRLIPFDQICPADTQPYRDQQGMGTACVVLSDL
jgi:curved DNA-binding protein CbpA